MSKQHRNPKAKTKTKAKAATSSVSVRPPGAQASGGFTPETRQAITEVSQRLLTTSILMVGSEE